MSAADTIEDVEMKEEKVRVDISHIYFFYYFQLVWRSEKFSLLQN